ncbi:TonB-dependent receptor [Novosphingobium sp. Gsoil 351]|uniref:TonB-dependent receptor n=1 Tax=Novosphingobium sp. Gsoil 351 TaxID=2675225 RepID=UPI0012B44BEE|nr:TonB-dependent receptor [Novosphingobium sp. Gsoil 351]QGN55832.1 TonB-dependent receptor [Novosphingobium sp. Gsoil 351]
MQHGKVLFAAALPLTGLPAHAYAQAQPQEAAAAAESPGALSEIIVTARKKEESLQDAPLAITAFTAEAIDEAALTNLRDVSLHTPGFQFNNQGGQEPGRYNTQLRFRGMSTSQFSPSFATGALFIDGVYVLNGGTSVSLMDVERIEVIKGPQSAQFGRNTFGGAVNFVTRSPRLTKASGQFETTVSARGRYDVQALFEGPLVRDVLSASIGGRFYSKRGEYHATDGGRLGDEQTTAVSGVLNFAPSSHFSARVRGFYSRDADGAPAGGFIDGDINDSCTGKTITTPTGQTASPKRYICGALPDRGDVVTLTGQDLFSSNTLIAQPVVQGGVNVPASYALDFYASQPQPGGIPFINRVGLRRNISRLSAIVNYNTGGWNVDVVAGMNRQRANWIRDADVTDTLGSFSNDPQRINDKSIEGRISTPQSWPIRAMIGANYYTQDFIAAGDGGAVVLYCVVTSDQTSFSKCQFPFRSASNFGNSDKTRVLGLFGSVEWDVTDTITLSAEGRQQRDRLTKGGTVTATGVGASAVKQTYKKFLPRIIARFEPSDATTLYASYAVGAIPGDINAAFIRGDARERAQYQTQFPDLNVSTGQEILKAYEIGWKQRALDNRLRFALAAYHYDWSNIKGRVTASINQTCRTAGAGVLGCDPAVNPTAAVGQPETVRDAGGALVPLLRGNNVLVTGDARIYGGELESSFALTDAWTIDANVAWAHARYKDYQFNFVAAIAGFTQMKGNAIPRFPEWSGNLAASWKGRLTSSLDGFFRADAIYFGKAFADESNLAFAKPYTLVNVRAGMDTGDLRFELFVNNLFDEDRYAAAARWSNFSRPVNFATFTAHQGINVSPQAKREVGLRLGAKF